ncbi:DUF4417 domain-containing protein [Bifidobacterium jacchi]|uniref:DUF4417 domain-containing protein n=1 Tax=Bifidobacterium jacchi TaxID=2490545 RepID=UPI00240DD3EE|nr:DUF4417 domain-containing protein [Bifidobacterium jacchi]
MLSSISTRTTPVSAPWPQIPTGTFPSCESSTESSPPDFSLYWGAPKPVLQGNVYRSRIIGHYLQRSGLPVVTNIRWGDEGTFDFCFLGVARHSMVAISTVGCISSRKEKTVFALGLEAMMSELEPARVIVNGPMPAEVFGRYWDAAEFHTYTSWTRRMKERSHGNR